MKKICGLFLLLLMTICGPTFARATELDPAYEAEAQLLIRTLIELNELYAEIWPFADPENWPEGGAVWSGDRPRRLVSLQLEGSRLVGPVDVSGLTRLESLSIGFSKVEVESPGLLAATNNPALKSLSIFGEDGQVSDGPVQTVLNLEALPALEELRLTNYGLRKLDLSHSPKLRLLEISINFNLKELDLSASTALESLSLYACSLKSLDLSHNPAIKSVGLESCGLEEINIGDNPLKNMDHFGADSCRLSLSGLAELARAIPGKLYVGTQRRVLFEKKVFPTVEEAVIDLSAEAVINGEPSQIVVLDDKLDIADPSRYSLDNGVLKFKKRGRYVVAMFNRAVNRDKDCDFLMGIMNFNQGHLPGLFTGHIEVGDVSDQEKITPSVC